MVYCGRSEEDEAVKKLLPILMLAMLTACGNRQAVEPGDGSNLTNVPNDSGGYAADLAEPPAEQATVDPKTLEANVEAGALTDSREREKEPENVDQPADEKPVETSTIDETPFLKERVKTGDARYASNAKPVAAFQFNKGVVYLELWPDVAPKHVESFKSLIGKQLLRRHLRASRRARLRCPGRRVRPPRNLFGLRPGSAAAVRAYEVPAEFQRQTAHQGYVVDVRRSNDPNSRAARFFLCLDRTSDLDGKYTVFGQVLGDGHGCGRPTRRRRQDRLRLDGQEVAATTGGRRWT